MADANDVQARVKAALDFLLQQSQNAVRSVDGYAPNANGNVDTKRLPLSGGTMTGAINFGSDSGIIHLKSENYDVLRIRGDTSSGLGTEAAPFLDLRTKNSINEPNTFFLSTVTEDGRCIGIVGFSDGRLLWNGVSVQSLGFPSGNYIPMTLGATGATYTMPCDGWLYLDKESNGTLNCYASFGNITKGYTQETRNPGRAQMIFPVSQGDLIVCHYDLVGTTYHFGLYKAKGVF